MSDLIERQKAIDSLMEIMDRPKHADFLYTDEICKTLNELPPAQSTMCEYWDIESSFCALHRPSTQPLSEAELTELEGRFGKYVRYVVEDMISGKGERWKT